MRPLNTIVSLAAFALVVGLGVTAYLTRDSWRAWLLPAKPAKEEEKAHAPEDRIKLTEQAQKNLRLVVEAALPEPYARRLLIPGIVVDRPGLSDRGVVGPVAGVVTKIAIQPGDTVKPGQALFSVRLLSEVFQQSQNELFKASRDLAIARELVTRLKASAAVVPGNRLIEAEAAESRLRTSITAYRQELLTRGLKPEQIDAVAEGKFVTEITVSAPAKVPEDSSVAGTAPTGTAANLEVQEVKVQLGEQVQAGQVLAMLANHQLLYVEGRAFKSEAALLETAAQNAWPVKVEFAEEAGGWPAFEETPTIRHLANTVDAESRTFAFYLPLTNQSRTYAKDGQTFLVWRFRPGQRVRLLVPIEQFPNKDQPEVFVFPSEAVARDGPEAYVFRQNGDVFQRLPVRVLFEEQDAVVVANDGSIGPGEFIARNGAAALLRAIKAKAATGSADPHAGHTH